MFEDLVVLGFHGGFSCFPAIPPTVHDKQGIYLHLDIELYKMVSDGYLDRIFMSPAAVRAGNLIREWMEDAGGLIAWEMYLVELRVGMLVLRLYYLVLIWILLLRPGYLVGKKASFLWYLH